MTRRPLSPEVGDEPIRNFPAICFVTRQVPAEELFFIPKSQDNDGQHPQDKRHSPPRPQGEREAEIYQEPAGVHGMSDHRIGSRGSHLLLGNNGNDYRREGVCLEDAELDPQTEQDADIGGDDQPGRDV